MGAFVSKTPVKVTVDDRPDEWINIVPKLGAGAQADLQNQLMSVKMEAGDEQKPEFAYAAGSMNVALLEAGITGWKLRGEPECGLELDEEGFVKFKHEYIGQLDLEDDLVDKALGELAKRNPFGGKKASAKPSD